METPIIIALIGAAGTVAAAVIPPYVAYRLKKSRSSPEPVPAALKPWRWFAIIAAIASLVALTVALWPDHSQSLAQQISDSAQFQVAINNLDKPINECMVGDMVLHGFYRSQGYVWEIWSQDLRQAPNEHISYGFPGGGSVRPQLGGHCESNGAQNESLGQGVQV